MTPSKQIEELIGRLEKASGPDWELDIEIGEIFFPEQYKALCEVFEKTWKRAQENGLHHRRLACWRGTFQGVWRFTYSIDAALTLVPEDVPGWEINFSYNGYPYMATVIDFSARVHSGSGKEPAIALCIAALRALSKEEA